MEMFFLIRCPLIRLYGVHGKWMIEWMNMELLSTDTDRESLNCSEKNPLLCQIDYHKSRTEYFGIEPG